MDEQLAQIYGTGQPVAHDEEDLQKTAAAELLVKLAESNGVSLDQFSDEDIQGMITELYQDKEAASKCSEGMPPFPPKKDEKEDKKDKGEDEGDEKKEKEAQAKFAEADFLGRVMAHAMVQELNNIDKTASPQQQEKQAAAPEQGAALEQLAQQRAWEMAKEAGYVDEQGNLITPQQPPKEKTSALKQAVDFRALQLLEEAGLPVEWKDQGKE
jgi:hypothetical protein